MADEAGSEAVQFVFAALALLAVTFGALHLALANAASIVLASELSQACLRIDVAGLRAAQDKEAFLSKEILDESSQLDSADLTVSNVSIESCEKESAAGGADGISQRVATTKVSYDVAYAIPLASAPGLGQGSFSRHVACRVEDERVVEVDAG